MSKAITQNRLEQKKKNVEQYKESRIRLSSTVIHRALEIQVETTSKCNLRCPMCYIDALQRDDNRKAADYGRTTELTQEVVEKIGPFLNTAVIAYLHGVGEPMLSPILFSLIAKAKAEGAMVWFSTNGTVMTNEQATLLVELLVDRVQFSLSAGTPETFETVHGGAKFETVLCNIRRLHERRIELGSRLPELTINFVAQGRNLEELPLLVSTVRDLGISLIDVKPLVPVDRFPENSYAQRQKRNYDPLVDEPIFRDACSIAGSCGINIDASYYRNSVPQFPVISHASLGHCLQPFRMMYVNRFGKVFPCCVGELLVGEKLIVGDIYEQSMEDIWNGSLIREVRRRIIEKNYYEGCITCMRNQLTFVDDGGLDDSEIFMAVIARLSRGQNY